MNWKIYIAWFVWFLPLTVWAQSDKIEEAYMFYTGKDFDRAAEVIDDVVATDRGAGNEVAWHIRGFIYKDLFLEAEDSMRGSQYREESVESFKRSISLDKGGKLKDQNIKALNYLAITYYNDASDIIGKHDPATIESAGDMFFTYRDLIQFLYPDTVLKNKMIDYYLAMATAHRKIYETDRKAYEDHWDQSNEMFMQVLELDPQSFKAYYSLAVSHYNKGAYHLQKLAEQEDLHDIFSIQNQSMRSIEHALPFMLKAYEIDPERIEAIRGLKIIYFNMNKEEESREFDRKQRDLKLDEE